MRDGETKQTQTPGFGRSCTRAGHVQVLLVAVVRWEYSGGRVLLGTRTWSRLLVHRFTFGCRGTTSVKKENGVL